MIRTFRTLKKRRMQRNAEVGLFTKPSMSQYLFKSLNRDVGKSIHQYDMISHGDNILVGVSGGKDSLTLLWILNERLSRIPVV